MGNNIVIWQFHSTEAQAATSRTATLWAAPLRQVTLDPSPASLDEATRQLPQGGYTTFRTFGGNKVMRLDCHFERLEETARLAGHPLTLDRVHVRCTLGRVLRQASAGADAGHAERESRVRLILDLEHRVGDLYCLVELLPLPNPRDYEVGVRAITRPMHRDNPKAKLTSFITASADVRRSKPAGINEVIMIAEDGQALEGISSNFFALRDGVLWTAEEGVLSGITRSLVLEVIAEQGIPLRLEGIASEELGNLEEAFITSASRAVLPVVEIDGKPVGSGKPGPVTRNLLKGYLKKVEAELEEV